MNTPRLRRGGGIVSSSIFFYLYWYSYIVCFVVPQLPSMERWALLSFWGFPAHSCFSELVILGTCIIFYIFLASVGTFSGSLYFIFLYLILG